MKKFGLVARTTMKWIAGASAAIAVMSLASAAGAATVLSTGVGNVGDPETNWSLTSPVGPTLTIVSGAQDYPGVWVTAPSGSNWITPSAAGGLATDTTVGEYDYSLSFTDPGTSVSIDWSSDNGATFFLNGNQVSSIGDTGYGSLTSFTINSFLASNTFEVKVQNVVCDSGCPNPTGLLVSASFGTGAGGTTPLPASLPLFGTGLGLIGLFARRMKRKSV